MEDKTFFLNSLLETPACREIHFFSTIDVSALLPIMVAMANETGGNIVIGIDEKHNVTGVQDAESQISILNDVVSRCVSPKLPCNIKELQYQNHKIVLISVWEGSLKPYLYEMAAYVFVGDAIVKADNRLFGLLFDKRASHDQSWEREKVYSASFDSLDYERILSILKNASDKRPHYKEISPEQFLEEQGLLSMGVPTNACLLLFAKNPVQFIPQSRIRLSLYSGEGTQKQLIQVSIFEGNMFDNLEAITKYLSSVYGTVIKIQGVNRQEESILPEVIFREGLLNAMVHRDYSVHRSFLNIVVNSSDLQIVNYGGLLEGITIPDLLHEHISILRNPDVANICYLSNLIEIAGSGTLRIIDECRLHIGLLPEWHESDNIINFTLHGLKHSRTAEAQSRKLKVASETQQQILDAMVDYIRSNPGCKLAQIQGITGKSLATTKRYVQLLRDNGIIEYQGALKTGGYELTH